MIVMLNLLIAIISETFAQVTAVSAQAGFQQKASMIAENEYLITPSLIQWLNNNDEYMICAT